MVYPLVSIVTSTAASSTVSEDTASATTSSFSALTSTVASSMSDTFSSVATSATSVVSSVGSTVSSAVTDATSAVSILTSTIATSVSEAISSATTNVISIVSSVASPDSSVSQVLSSAMTSAGSSPVVSSEVMSSTPSTTVSNVVSSTVAGERSLNTTIQKVGEAICHLLTNVGNGGNVSFSFDSHSMVARACHYGAGVGGNCTSHNTSLFHDNNTLAAPNVIEQLSQIVMNCTGLSEQNLIDGNSNDRNACVLIPSSGWQELCLGMLTATVVFSGLCALNHCARAFRRRIRAVLNNRNGYDYYDDDDYGNNEEEVGEPIYEGISDPEENATNQNEEEEHIYENLEDLLIRVNSHINVDGEEAVEAVSCSGQETTRL